MRCELDVYYHVEILETGWAFKHHKFEKQIYTLDPEMNPYSFNLKYRYSICPKE